MIYIIIGILIIISCGIIIAINYIKLKDLNNNIEICRDSIDQTLKNKQEMLDKIVRDAKEKKLINDLKIDNNINIFDFEQILFDVKWNLSKLISNEKYKPEKDINKILKDLNELEDALEGLKDYYNSKSITYNEIYYKKPLTYIYHLLKLPQQKTFKLRSMEELEILKN